jgi:hypothetical protein
VAWERSIELHHFTGRHGVQRRCRVPGQQLKLQLRRELRVFGNDAGHATDAVDDTAATSAGAVADGATKEELMADTPGAKDTDPGRKTHEQTAYDKAYKQRPSYKAHARMRAKARYHMIKKLGRKALAGMEIDHIKPLAEGGSNDPSNWRAIPAAKNKAAGARVGASQH